MLDPHVVALYYWLETDSSLIFNHPLPLDHDTDEFTLRLAKGVLTCTMKGHYTIVDDAQAAVDPFLRAWELDVALQRGSKVLWFMFERADLSTATLTRKDNTLGAAYAIAPITWREYPAPPTRFKASPDVETLWHRYEGYKQGREPLPGMAYACQSFIEKVLARGRSDAAQKYHIEPEVLSTLGNLHSHRGDLTSRRKLEHERDRHEPPLTPSEIAWMEAAVRMLIRRIGEYAADPTASWPMLSMRDLPPL